MTRSEYIEKKALDRLTGLLKDSMDGDNGANKILDKLSIDPIVQKQIKEAIQLLFSNNYDDPSKLTEYINNSWRLYYHTKPPTPSEFLTEKYLGPSALTLFPNVKDTFVEFLDPIKNYKTLVLYPHIGWGKSTLASYINIYLATLISYMKAPYRAFGLSAGVSLHLAMGSFTIDKTVALLYAPFLNTLDTMPIFEKVDRKDSAERLRNEQLESQGYLTKIPYTTATEEGKMKFAGGPIVSITPGPDKIVGLNIVCGTLSELAFFHLANKNDTYAIEFFDNFRERIDSRMNGGYFGKFILDSSPYNLESKVDKWINNVAPTERRTLIVKGPRWGTSRFKAEYKNIIPELYDNPSKGDIVDHKYCFPVFKGGEGKPAYVLEDVNEVKKLNPNDILWAPKTTETIESFKNNTAKALQNLGGLPAGMAPRIFSDVKMVERVFNENLRSIRTHIEASSSETPEGLIWNKIKDTFFNFDQVNKTYRYYYKPWIPRVISVDGSKSKDVTAISIMHLEKSSQSSYSSNLGEEYDVYPIVYIVDMLICIIPGKGHINSEAIGEFIKDLKHKGGLNIAGVSFDQYQSLTNIQNLKRKGFNAVNLSVDSPSTPYEDMIAIVQSNSLVSGRNLHLKNNMLGIQWTETKVAKNKKADHIQGDLILSGDDSWETSLIGSNAKDALDAVTANITLAKNLGLTNNVYEKYDPSSFVQRSEKEAINFFMSQLT